MSPKIYVNEFYYRIMSKEAYSKKKNSKELIKLYWNTRYDFSSMDKKRALLSIQCPLMGDPSSFITSISNQRFSPD